MTYREPAAAGSRCKVVSLYGAFVATWTSREP
jgi:hypothetical protein